MRPNFVLAMTGASGAIYGVRLLQVLVESGCDVQLTISPAGLAVVKQELQLEPDLDQFRVSDLLLPQESLDAHPSKLLREVLSAPQAGSHQQAAVHGNVHYHHYRNLMAPIASGSARTSGMVVCPCSGGTLSAIAHGTSENLIHRAADVHLKERRKLILVPRETPLSLVQLDNMRRSVEAGAIVLPAMPGYYHGVHRLRDLVDFVVARICDHLSIEHSLMRRWGD